MTKDEEISHLKSSLQNYQEKYEQSVQTIDQLLHRIKQLQRDRYGVRSEKYTYISNGQQFLFESEELIDEADNDDESDDSSPVKGHRRKKRSHISDYDHLPTRTETIAVSDADRYCHCGCEKKVVDLSLIHI